MLWQQWENACSSVNVGRLSPAQRHILLLVPLKRLREILRLKIRPEPIHHKKVRIHRLDGQKSGQAPHSFPANYQIDPGNIVGTKLSANLLPAAAGILQLGKIPFPAVIDEKIDLHAAAVPICPGGIGQQLFRESGRVFVSGHKDGNRF